MTDAERITELEAELVEVRAAKSRMYKVGQSSNIGTGKSTRQFTEINFPDLVKRENEIIAELYSLGWDDDSSNKGAVALKAGW